MTKIISVAQLALLPDGAVVSQIKTINGQMEFDCQGVLQLEHKARISGKWSCYIELTPLQPDIHIVHGRIEERYTPSTFYFGKDAYPNRFVLWDENYHAWL